MKTSVPHFILLIGIASVAFGGYLLISQTPAQNAVNQTVSQNASSINVPLSTPWTNTGVTVRAGQTLIVSASGKGIWKNIAGGNPNAYPKPFEECGPDGTPPVDTQDYYSNIASYPTRDAYKGALIGRIGERGAPFKVGTRLNRKMSESGTLYLGINDMKPEIDRSSFADNSGAYSVTVETSGAGAASEFRPKRTTPQGAMLGDAANGIYYANTDNSLQAGVAYKFQKGETVYIYDGEKMRGVATASAFFNFYGCNGNTRIVDCAPVYLMPSFVTKDMLNGEVMK